MGNVADHAIFMLDAEGTITEWTEGARKVGYAAEEVVGRHFSMFYTPEDVASGEPERLLEQAAREGRAEREAWRVRKDGGRIWANEVVTAVRDAEGRLVGFTKISRDLTERRALEQERERVRAVELIARAEVSERERISRELHDRVAHRMGVVHQSLSFSRRLGRAPRAGRREAGSGQTEHQASPRPDPQPLGRAEEPAGGGAGRGARGRLRQARRVLPPGRHGDGRLLLGEESALPDPVGMQVYLAMREAIRNAVKHAGCSRIGVALKVRDGDVHVLVEDDGEGFDPEAVEVATPSSGVGLRSMRERLEMLGGSLRVYSEPGAGSKVEMRVPLDGRRP